MTVEAEDFKSALRLWASGVTVVTTQSEQYGLQGMTATSFSSVSLEPPQILVCLNTEADTYQGVEACQTFAVNILHADQQAVSDDFSGGCSHEDRFAKVKWQPGSALGTPIFDDCLASLECTLSQKLLAGSHWVIVGEVQAVNCQGDDPLLYYHSAYRYLKNSS